MPARGKLLVLVALLSGLRPVGARAQEAETEAATASQSDDERRAHRLFVEGREAAAGGNYALACHKFTLSLALFRRASTLLNLGECHQALGHLVTALELWRQAAALLEPTDKRMQMAKESIAALEARVPQIRLTLPERLPRGTTLLVDGAAARSLAPEQELRLDPGRHRLRLEAPGFSATEVEVRLADGEHRAQRLELPRRVPPPPTRQTPAWVWPVGGVGIALGLAAIPFAVDYASTVSRQRELCGGELETCQPDPPGSYDPAEDNERKQRDAAVGTVLGVAGGVALAVGIIGALVGVEVETGSGALRIEPMAGGIAGVRLVSILAER